MKQARSKKLVIRKAGAALSGKQRIEAMERAYREAKERLRFAIESAGIGTWDYNPMTGDLYWDNRCRELCGLHADRPVTYDLFTASIVPEDREVVNNTVFAALEGQNHGEYEVQYRSIGLDDKQFRWLKSRGKVYFTDEGVPAHFIGTVLDITSLVAHEEATTELMRKKDEFMSIASHELKTPLTGLKIALQVIEKIAEKDPQSDILNFIQTANRQMNKLTGILKNLLDVTRLQESRMDLEQDYHDLRNIIELQAQEIAQSCGSHQIKVTGDAGSAYIDRTRIEQVISNLVTNAIKYSPNAKEVHIAVRKNGHELKVAVTDFGIGIAEDNIPKVFDRYYRVESTSKNFPGVGLGLYIAAGIVRQHGGEIGVESTKGKGSTFWFTLPAQS